MYVIGVSVLISPFLAVFNVTIPGSHFSAGTSILISEFFPDVTTLMLVIASAPGRSISVIWSRLAPLKVRTPPRSTGFGPYDNTDISLPYWSVFKSSRSHDVNANVLHINSRTNQRKDLLCLFIMIDVYCFCLFAVLAVGWLPASANFIH